MMQNNCTLRVAICDDESLLWEQLKGLIIKVFDEENMGYEIKEYVSGKELLDQVDETDLVFLDIDMPEIDGIETGERIRDINPDCRIIIASGREDRFKETYDIDALRFISKPYCEKEVRGAIEKYRNKFMLGMEEIEVFTERKPVTIRQRDIEYISAYKGGVEIKANGELYHSDYSIRKIAKMLDDTCFFRVHKSCIINMFHVQKEMEDAIVVGKVIIPVSRRNRQEFRQRFRDFDVKYR